MRDGLNRLSEMEYPGRMLALGMNKEGDKYVALYAITGRSESSQARTLKIDEKFDVVRTRVTDYKQLEEGSPALLLYPAMFAYGGALGVSNGFQTNLIYTALRNRTVSPIRPARILENAFREPFYVLDGKEGAIDVTKSEPDAPNFTPRISGLIINGQAAFHITKQQNGSEYANIMQFQLEAGKGWFVTTYDGPNSNPLPSFTGNPIEFKVNWDRPEDMAKYLYRNVHLLGYCGKKFDKDFRVAVSAAEYDPVTHKLETFEVNRHDLEAKR